MSAERIGVLILQIQADEARPRDLREFLQLLIESEELRRTAGLANSFSGLQEAERERHCIAMTLFLLSSRELVPVAAFEGDHSYETRGSFTLDFPHVMNGPWRGHVKNIREGAIDRSNPAETFRVSPLLGEVLKAVQEFWGVTDKYVW